MSERKERGTNAGNILQQGYECKVGLEALERAGRNPQLKGIVHEMLFRDKLNLRNLLTGKNAALSASTTAVRDDIVVREGARIVERFQLKDAPGSIGKVMRQVSENKYAGTRLVGTSETAELYAKAGGGVSKKMLSSGISSKTTERIADKALGNMTSLKNALHGAGSAGVVGAALGAGITAVCSAKEFVNGKIDGAEFAVRVAKGGTCGGVSAAGGALVASAASAATATALTYTGIGAALAATTFGAAVVTFAPVVIATGAAIVAGGMISSFFEEIFS